MLLGHESTLLSWQPHQSGWTPDLSLELQPLSDFGFMPGVCKNPIFLKSGRRQQPKTFSRMLRAYNASRLQLTAYMLTCLHAYLLACLHNTALTPL